MSTFDCRHDLLCGVPHHQHCSLKALDIEVFLLVTTDLRSSFDGSVNRLGVLLHGEILDHLLLNDRSRALECVHDIPCSISDLLKSFASVATLLFALPAVGFALLACCWLCSSACCWLCSCIACSWLCSFSSFDHVSRSSMYFSLSSCPCCHHCSLAVVPSLFLSRVNLW